MQVQSFAFDLETNVWSPPLAAHADSPRTLVLAFGAPELVDDPAPFAELARAYPRSIIVGCSTAGEIHGTLVRDRSLAVTVTRFEKTDLALAALEIAGPDDSFAAGEELAKRLAARPGLRGVLVLSEGLHVNGSQLVRGLNAALDENVVVTGGLSGDGSRFQRTWVGVGSDVRPDVACAVGFYGDFVQIGHGSKGGWDKFGPERLVTRAEGNVLYELDGKPALRLYKEYLGDKAKDLPASGLLFPLSLRAGTSDDKFLVRTLLAVDHEADSLTFAGDIPQGYLAQLMKADFDRLVGGASIATAMARENGAPVGGDTLVVAISCVGRRLVLGERIEEEVEAVLEALPTTETSHLTGFYSYGEISPYATGHCDLHNQTMTLTVVSESKTPLPNRTRPGLRVAPTAAAAPSAARPPAPQAAPQSGPTRRPPTPKPPPRVPVSTEDLLDVDSGTTPSLAAASAVPPRPRHVDVTPPPSRVAPPSRVTPPVAPAPARTAAETRESLTHASATGASVRRSSRGDVTLLTIGGRLTESFQGDAVGRELQGVVAFDLAGVERITSFGVREWLAMLGASQASRLYLLRCSEAVVNQLSMIRRFAGSGQIVSFFAPYLCGGCGEAFERTFDCEKDAEVLRAAQPPPAPCPRCGSVGAFDDDARSYFAFATSHLQAPVPREIRAIEDELGLAAPSPALDAVDKTVDGDVTRLRLTTALGASVRWKRVLDGIEGALVIDLGGVNAVEDAGAANLERGLAVLGPEVTSIAIERCPAALAERFARGGLPPRVTVSSAALDAYCPACAVQRPALVSVVEHEGALDAGLVPRVACKRCNGDLTLRAPEQILRFMQAQRAAQRSAVAQATPANDTANSSRVPVSLGGMAVGGAPSSDGARGGSATAARTSVFGTPTRRSTMTFAALGALSLAVMLLLARELTHRSAPEATAGAAAAERATDDTTSSAAETPGAPSTAASSAAKEPEIQGWASDVGLPPAWVERPFVIDRDDVLVVGQSAPAATPELATAATRTSAIVRLVTQVHQDLLGTPVHDFVAARARLADGSSDEAIAARYLRQFGTTATPERVDVALRKRDAAVDGFCRYRLPKTVYQQVVAAYRETASVQGLVVARFFPLLESAIRTDGDLVVLSVQRGRPVDAQGTRPGDIVLGVSGRQAHSVDALARAAESEWAATLPRGVMTLELESGGAKRTVRLTKPVPGN